ncbi:MAG: radical SAM/SPASM domain-containing protein [Anaerorhabdus sp.]|uniref:radical SAM/SPASM domain-containing protein n=1 Tax=Anaerorhabdus sp. TaxID=1872524 RepID=UPI003A8AA1E6
MSIKRVYIEITNRCNLRCNFCSFHHRELKEMSLRQFEAIIKQIQPYTSYIYLHVQGEPLLHSQFDDILNLCDQYELKVQLVTNGTFLKNYPSLSSHPSLRKLSLSLHSLDFQTCDIHEYMNEIFSFINNNHTNCYVELRFWTSDNLSNNASTALSLIKEKYEFQQTTKPNSFKLLPQVFLHFENQFEWPSTAVLPSTKLGTCRGGKEMIAILVDGTVVPCCLDAEGQIDLGNIYTEDLNSILCSKRFTDIIKGFNDNQLIEPLCQKCTYRNRFN